MKATFFTIGSPNNRPDRFEFGCVPYVFEMAKYQLSNADWCEFLNAVGYAKAISLKLYHKDMGSGILGGIICRGEHVEHGESFGCKEGWEKKPVVYVRYEDVCRYCNWLTTGDTESGSYDMTQEVPTRLSGAKYFIPTDNEWYKSAYYRGGYYANYPTGNDLPTLEQANFERGDTFAPIALTPIPQSTCSTRSPWLNYFYLADVDAFSNVPSPFGCVQMGGNAWEMLETVSRDAHGAWQNHYRGGSFGYTETGLSKQNRDSAPYNGRCYVFGVRIARIKDGWVPMKIPMKFGIILSIKRGIRLCRKILNLR